MDNSKQGGFLMLLKKLYGIEASSVNHTCVFFSAFNKQPDFKCLKRKYQPYFTKNGYGTIHKAEATEVKKFKDLQHYTPNYTPGGRSWKEKIKLISFGRKKIRLEVIIPLS